MKKYLLVSFLIFILLVNMQSVFASDSNEKIVYSNKVSNDIFMMKEQSFEKYEELLNELKVEEDSEVKNKLISKIKQNMILMNLDANIKDVHVSGDKIRYVLDVEHNYNLATWLNYQMRLSNEKEKYMQRDEQLPYDIEVTCFKETLDLCPNKKSKCTLEFEESEDDDDELQISGFISLIKSFIF